MGIRESLADSIAGADWLTVADQAAIATAYLLADRLEAASDPAELINYSKAFTAILTALGLTVAGRTGKAESKGELGLLSGLIREAADIRKPAAAGGGGTKRKSANSRKPS